MTARPLKAIILILSLIMSNARATQEENAR